MKDASFIGGTNTNYLLTNLFSNTIFLEKFKEKSFY